MNSKRYSDKLYEVREVSDLKDIITQSTSLFADKTAYLVKNQRLGRFVPITYRQVREDMDAYGTRLIDMGLKGKKIAVIGESGYYWILTYFATVAGVGSIVPLDKNLPRDEILSLAQRAEVSAIVYSDKAYNSIEPLFENPGTIEYFISIDGTAKAAAKAEAAVTDADGSAKGGSGNVLSVSGLIDEGVKLLRSGDKRYINANIDPDEMAALLFTSGTTGMSKGVMLSQRNIAANCMHMSKYFKIPEPGIVLSILPIHHAYEMTCDIWTTFYQGKTIAICEGLKYIQKNMAEVKANVLLGVPLVFEKVYKGMWKQAESRGEASKLRNAIDISRRLKLYNNKAVCRKLFKAIHSSFGGEMQKFVSGGAAIDPKVIEDFEAMGFTMIQGYGMTENSPIVCVNRDRYSKAASVGKPMPGTEVRIVDSDEDGIGEVICKGPSVMLGYYKDQKTTEEVIRNGWLHTGDLGYMDDEGFVYLTGRKKTVIVTKGGKNIFPEELEAVLAEDEHIREVLIHGINDNRVGNVMITADIFPNYDVLSAENGEMDPSQVYHFFKDLIDKVNGKLPPYKKIKRINIRNEEFSKTTTGKIKRFGNASGTDSGSENHPATLTEMRKRQEKKAKAKMNTLRRSDDEAVAYLNVRAIPELKTMLETSADMHGDKVAIYQKFGKNEPYTEITYKRLLADVNAMGTALLNRGLKDKRIAVMGRNCYQWAVSYLALICGVGVCVPLDKELPPEELKQLIIDADVSCVLFDGDFEKIFLEMADEGKTGIRTLVNFDGSAISSGAATGGELNNVATDFGAATGGEFGDAATGFGTADKGAADKSAADRLYFDDMIAAGRKQLATGDRQFLDAEIDAEKMAVILYTSGTTGVAKGVMLSHANICDNLMGAPTYMKISTDDIFFSILPIHHTYECTCGFLIPLYMGASIAYCQGLRYIEKNMKEVRPTFFLGVPVLIEGLYKKIWKEIRKQGKENSLKKILAVNKISKRVNLNVVKPFVKDIYEVFGGRIKMIISGGAAIDPEVLEFFNDIGIKAVQGYGLTECSPLAALNPDREKLMKNRSVGHVLPGMDVKIMDKSEDGIGEIVLRGPSVMLGYYGNKEATDEVLKDGWFHTGDLGYLDGDKYIYITGRLKNIIITQNGKNVYPEELENYIKLIPYVEEVMVWGQESEINDKETTIVASVIVDEEAVAEALGEGYTQEEEQDLIWEEIDKVNEKLPLFKRIKKVVIREEDFEKTTAKKIKRFVKKNKEE